jgi:ribosomal protein L11 methylase PrmA
MRSIGTQTEDRATQPLIAEHNRLFAVHNLLIAVHQLLIAQHNLLIVAPSVLIAGGCLLSKPERAFVSAYDALPHLHIPQAARLCGYALR